MPDKYAEKQDEWECRGQGILSFVSDLYSSDTVYHRWCQNFPTCKRGFPEIVHNTDSLKRGVLKGSSTIHENVQVIQKTASNNKQLS